MPAEAALPLAFALALVCTYAFLPAAMAAARRTGLIDRPEGYKGHATATPLLGGVAVVLAIAIPGLALGDGTTEYAAIALCTALLCLVGTVDDKVGLGPLSRVVVEAACAAILWEAGLGWDIAGVLGFALTVVWVVGIINAYNLMDNMDGAAGTVAAVSTAGLALIAVVANSMELAALALATAGACVAFVHFNYPPPARVFLGDGGSMPLGFLVAAIAMVVPVHDELGLLTVAALAPVAGLPMLDTALVVVSRRRRGVNVLSGGRDHLTHRLRARLGSVGAVMAVLAAAQGALCLVALALVHLEPAAVVGIVADSASRPARRRSGRSSARRRFASNGSRIATSRALVTAGPESSL